MKCSPAHSTGVTAANAQRSSRNRRLSTANGANGHRGVSVAGPVGPECRIPKDIAPTHREYIVSFWVSGPRNTQVSLLSSAITFDRVLDGGQMWPRNKECQLECSPGNFWNCFTATAIDRCNDLTYHPCVIFITEVIKRPQSYANYQRYET